MTYLISENQDGTTSIQVNFEDENVDVQGATKVKGTESDALKYVAIFEADLRVNFAEHFPLPAPETEADQEGGII